MSKSHKDVEFAVDTRAGEERIFKTFDEAAGFAVMVGYTDGRPVNIDILVHSEAGANWLGGSDEVETYREDPEASVHQRIEIKVDVLGRIA